MIRTNYINLYIEIYNRKNEKYNFSKRDIQKTPFFVDYNAI
ncbi:hypothetical protein Prede_2520 [Prevotella dentalis DSM 3688]|uniref:Uncharacterized protein n=1 Tax=Prevotella dentalis (strain ATCC 49559 / DSM 3688 / JCM 13448 / NCTC 12043 / ES 2772) TaxID=908937 RepID=L0JE05_PREDD|nr:hypothetical protein Prede_2520 [Prevotella dentalis DSM 3688]